MGLTNASGIFMHTMNSLFSNMLNYGISLFLDDILVDSFTAKEHFCIPRKSTDTLTSVYILLQA